MGRRRHGKVLLVDGPGATDTRPGFGEEAIKRSAGNSPIAGDRRGSAPLALILTHHERLSRGKKKKMARGKAGAGGWIQPVRAGGECRGWAGEGCWGLGGGGKRARWGEANRVAVDVGGRS
jgi:hypothetical protein